MDCSTYILPYDSFPPKWRFILNFKVQINTEYFTIYRITYTSVEERKTCLFNAKSNSCQCLQAYDVQYGLQKSCNYSLAHINQAKL